MSREEREGQQVIDLLEVVEEAEERIIDLLDVVEEEEKRAPTKVAFVNASLQEEMMKRWKKRRSASPASSFRASQSASFGKKSKN